jgi:hypothetical protein
MLKWTHIKLNEPGLMDLEDWMIDSTAVRRLFLSVLGLQFRMDDESLESQDRFVNIFCNACAGFFLKISAGSNE